MVRLSRLHLASLAVLVVGCGGGTTRGGSSSPHSAPSQSWAPVPAAPVGGQEPQPSTAAPAAATGGVTTSHQGDAARLPQGVRALLERYVGALKQCRSIEDCAAAITPMAGGGLVNEDGSLRDTVPPYSLKKDWQNVHHYAVPLVVTRVDVRPNRTTGFGPTALSGTEYKVFIGKLQGRAGMPAPIGILVPDGRPSDPRLVSIGSL